MNITSKYFDNLHKGSLTLIDVSVQWWMQPRVLISSMNIEEGAFRNFSALIKLQLCHNVVPASSLHTMLTDLNGSPLLSLDLTYCVFGRIITNHLFSTFHNNSLHILNMSNTQIEIIENGAFSNLNQLEVLKLTGTNLKIIDTQMFAGLCNLVFLDITGTNVVYFNISDTFSQLQTLHLSLVNPTDDPAEDGYVSRGSGIRYSHIYITAHHFPNLKHLTIAYYERPFSSYIHINALASLETFTCINCKLKMHDLPRLNMAILINCHNSATKTWFTGMESLATIHIIQEDQTLF